MEPDRLARAKTIFQAAADLDADERDRFLAEACGGDAELRGLLEILLERHDAGMGSFLLSPPALPAVVPPEASDMAPLSPRADPTRPGHSGDSTRPRPPGHSTSPMATAAPQSSSEARAFPLLPGYRILRQIGEGGMGTVYEAEQERPHRRVALKVIRGGAYVTDQQVRLFRREVESLARLNHPSIAAIYDAGRTPFGQHFFTMELVQGVPLSDWLRAAPEEGRARGRQELRRRLELFLAVCEAISYAHQRGVIHRDLKPTNIFVVEDERSGSTTTGHGRPRVKVLDFGLARITDADVTVTTLESDVGRIQGTLAYMSPEQARGDPHAIDTRTDVYSLGVILYELLTGQRPYDVQKTLIPEALRVIQEEEPGRPSAVRPHLRGDLETIVLKALEKDPDRRYAGVAALAEDVARYLAEQPILARPPTTMYQLRKLVQRHKAPFAFAAVLFVVLIASTVTMSVLYERQRRERARAGREATKAERTTEFLQDMLASASPYEAQGRPITVEEILDEASERIEKELTDQPEVRGAIQMTIAKTYASLLRPAQAGPHYQDALTTLRECLGEDDPQVLRAKLAVATFKGGPESEQMLHEVIRKVRQSRDPDPELLSGALYRLSERRARQGQVAEAESLVSEAIEIRRRAFGEESVEVVYILQDLGSYQKARGDHEAARDTYRQALDIYQRVHPETDLWTATYVLRLAQSYPEDAAMADSLWWESLRLAREGAGGDHPALATWIKDGGYYMVWDGRLDEAERYFRESAEMRIRLYGPDNTQPGTSTTNIAEVLHAQGRLDEAERTYLEALRCFGWGKTGERIDINGPSWDLAVWPLRGYAELLLARGDLGAAEEAFRELVAATEKAKSAEPYDLADARLRLGNCLARQGRSAEAESLMVESCRVIQEEGPRQLQVGSPFWADYKSSALERVIDLYERQGKSAAAEPYRALLTAAREAEGTLPRLTPPRPPPPG